MDKDQCLYGGRFRDPVIAVSMLASLPCWGFVIFRGKVIIKTPKGYKKENGAKWSRSMKYASSALWWQPKRRGATL